MCIRDRYTRAEKLHIETDVKRVVYIIETKHEKDTSALETVRTLFAGKVRDFITAVDEKNIILVKEVKGTETYDELDKTAEVIIDMLNTEAVSYTHLDVYKRQVQGTVIEINPDYGVYVAVDDRYFGMIPKNEVFGKIQIGDTIHGRVSKVRDDHKLSISLKQKAYIQMDEDSSIIYHAIEKRGGRLPFTDKAAPEIIKAEFDMSKNAFKRAVGRDVYKRQESVCLQYQLTEWIGTAAVSTYKSNA